jgi:hypothetical protein
VEPDVVAPADRGDLGERIDDARAHRAGRADDQERQRAAAVGDDLPLERGDVHPLLASASIQRIASVPRPNMSAAF